jgi:hypothetical protein
MEHTDEPSAASGSQAQNNSPFGTICLTTSIFEHAFFMDASQRNVFAIRRLSVDHNVDVQQRDETDNDIGNGGHRLSLGC